MKPFLLLAALNFSAPAWAIEYGAFLAQKRQIQANPEGAYFAWSALPASMLSQEGPDPVVQELRRHVQKTYGRLSTRGLIQRQRAVYEKAYGPDPKKNPELALFDLILRGSVGKLRPLTQLESSLTRLHIELNKNLKPRSEYFAFILRKGDHLNVYAGIGLRGDGWPPNFAPTLWRVKEDLRQGWRLVAHLHSHPFAAVENIDWGGSVVPSDPDFQSFRSMAAGLGLKSMLITNGIDTLEVPASDLKKYSGH